MTTTRHAAGQAAQMEGQVDSASPSNDEQAAGQAAQAAAAAQARARIWARLRPYERAFVQQYDYRFTADDDAEYSMPPMPWYVPPEMSEEEYERRLDEEREQAFEYEWRKTHPEPPQPPPPYIPHVVPRPPSKRAWMEAGFTIMDRTRLRRPLAPYFGDRGDAYGHDVIAEEEGTLWIPIADAARIMGVSLSAVRQWKRRHNHDRRTYWRPLPTLEGGHAGTFFRLYDVLQRALVLEGGLR